MPLHFNIANIDDYDGKDKPNHSDLFDDDENDEIEDYEPDCFFCNATGEGYSPDSVCSYCNGRGTIKKRKY